MDCKRLLRTASALGAVASAAVVLSRVGGNRRRMRVVLHRAARRFRYTAGRVEGLCYRMSGRQPNPDVDPGVLADRVRSALGPLEHRLDLPRAHVMAEGHVVLLHGEVATAAEARAIEEAVRRVSGVDGIESYLHIGLLPSDTRPSEGVTHPRSAALEALLSAARDAGADEGSALSAVRAVLAALGEEVPLQEWGHFTSHLPADVRELAGPPRRHGKVHHWHHVTEFVAAVGVGSVDDVSATRLVEAVLATLRGLVPEGDSSTIAAVLPRELREFWVAGASK